MEQIKTVVVGISGGVDSSVAALLLKKQGYNVIGVFMKNWEEDEGDGHCTAAKDSLDAQAVCEKLGIPFFETNFSKEYRDNVFSEFLTDLENGLTPNPDVLCNREIKFKPFLNYALSLGADYIATGHYADVKKVGNYFTLCKCKDDNKDQTYFLNQLGQFELSKTLFPLANLDKSEVRKLASDNGFVTATKKDSTGICFIGERNFRNFLKGYIFTKPGDIKLSDGRVIGRHDGLCYYTLGQSKGLNIGGIKGERDVKRVVVKKDLATNSLIVAPEDDPMLFSSGLKTFDFNFTSEPIKAGSTIDCTAKFRHRQKDQNVTATFNLDGTVNITFQTKQRAITSGQYAVLYKNEICIGGGKINEVYFT